MAKHPVFLALDRYDVTPRSEVCEASIDLIRNAEQRQHALMTRHGGAPVFVDFVAIVTSADTRRVTVQVPPGVTYCDIGLCLFGSGAAAITGAADATGTRLTVRGETASTLAEHARWVWTGGLLDAALGASSGRAICVSSSVSWTIQDVELQVSLESVDTRLGVVGMVLVPIHLPV